MTEQLSLTGATTLTDRQAHALGIIATRQPIRSDDLGAHLHAYRLEQGGRGHTASDTCDWCTSEGRSVGDALAAKGLVRYVRGKGWVTLTHDGQSDASGFSTSDDVEKAEAPSQIGRDDPWPADFF